MTATAERQRWVVETMAVAPGDRVLEIGCGRGVAVSLICQRLGSGKITAIDRSAAMVRIASQRSAAYVESGMAEVRCEEFEKVTFPVGHFDKIFAVNVSLFWLDTAPGHIDRVKRLLAPEGMLYVFSERPTLAGANAIGDRTGTLLRAHGFTAERITVNSSRGNPLTCVSGAVS